MQQIPISDLPAQILRITLGGQRCRIRLYETVGYGMFCDLYVNDALLIGGASCRNLNRIVRDSWLGFTGDLFFQDTQGNDDPSYPGLGARFLLWYLEASDG